MCPFFAIQQNIKKKIAEIFLPFSSDVMKALYPGPHNPIDQVLACSVWYIRTSKFLNIKL